MIKQSLTTFRKIQRDLGKKLIAEHELVCKVGAYKGSAVVKLQKESWTNDPMKVVSNTSGIFFSVWMDERSASVGRVYYNIHALKLRQLRGYHIRKSTDFAAEFRKRFTRNSWPNVSVDYGPLTLMQGWMTVTVESFETDVRELLNRFVQLYPTIDDLLDQRVHT